MVTRKNHIPDPPPEPLGYVVVIREHGRWEANWDGEVHPTREAGETSLREARAAGYETELTALGPLGYHDESRS